MLQKNPEMFLEPRVVAYWPSANLHMEARLSFVCKDIVFYVARCGYVIGFVHAMLLHVVYVTCQLPVLICCGFMYTTS